MELVPAVDQHAQGPASTGQRRQQQLRLVANGSEGGSADKPVPAEGHDDRDADRAQAQALPIDGLSARQMSPSRATGLHLRRPGSATAPGTGTPISMCNSRLDQHGMALQYHTGPTRLGRARRRATKSIQWEIANRGTTIGGSHLGDRRSAARGRSIDGLIVTAGLFAAQLRQSWRVPAANVDRRRIYGRCSQLHCI